MVACVPGTCLHFAMANENGPEQVLELLLATPAAMSLSVDACDAAGRSALHLAAALGCVFSLSLVLFCVFVSIHAIIGTRARHLRLLCLLRAIADMTSTRRQECVKMLLSRGANPDLPDAAGRTPLHLAAYVIVFFFSFKGIYSILQCIWYSVCDLRIK